MIEVAEQTEVEGVLNVTFRDSITGLDHVEEIEIGELTEDQINLEIESRRTILEESGNLSF